MTLSLDLNGSIGRERLAELHVAASPFGPPMIGADPVAHEERREPFGKRLMGRAVRGFGSPHRNGLEPGKCHRDAGAAEEGAAMDSGHRGLHGLITSQGRSDRNPDLLKNRQAGKPDLRYSRSSSRPRRSRNCRLVIIDEIKLSNRKPSAASLLDIVLIHGSSESKSPRPRA